MCEFSYLFDDISNHHLIQTTINVLILSMHNKMQMKIITVAE